MDPSFLNHLVNKEIALTYVDSPLGDKDSSVDALNYYEYITLYYYYIYIMIYYIMNYSELNRVIVIMISILFNINKKLIFSAISPNTS